MEFTPPKNRIAVEKTVFLKATASISMHAPSVKASPFDVSQMSGVVVSFNEKPRINGAKFVGELKWLQKEAAKRCLLDAELWASEMLAYCPEKFLVHALVEEPMDYGSSLLDDHRKGQQSRFARVLIKDRDYTRAAFFLAKTKDEDEIDRFLYYRCKFLSSWQKVLEDDAESIERRVTFGTVKTGFSDLYKELNQEDLTADVFLLYLKGLIEIELGIKEQALITMNRVIDIEPRLWPAWEVIAKLVNSIEEADKIQVEQSKKSAWLSDWFMILVLERFHQYAMAIQWAERLVERGLTGIPFIITKIAACSNCRHDHDQAIENFEQLRKKDPYRIQDLQLYSDSLYIRKDETKLSQLALTLYETHKFRWETCCIVANYYAIRRDSEQAIKFFHRALKLNPQAAWLWVLIGHEYMELKNTPVACVSYRKAIELDPQEYRAWYGLGQMYDIVKMHGYALFYYQQAQKCRPHDSRMLIALGDVYAKLDKVTDAEKCFTGAYLFGDIEGQALWMLAKLYEAKKMDEKAAKTLEAYIVVYSSVTNVEENLQYAVLFLTQYYFKKEDYEKATKFATKCLEYDQICQEGNRVLRDIAQLKQKKEPGYGTMAGGGAEEEVSDLNSPNSSPNHEDAMLISDDDDDVSF